MFFDFFVSFMTFKYWILVLDTFLKCKNSIQCEFYKIDFRLISLSVSQSKNSLVLAYKMVLVCMALVYMVLVYKQLLFHQPFRTLVHGSYHDVCRMDHGCSRNTFPHVHHMNRPTWAKCKIRKKHEFNDLLPSLSCKSNNWMIIWLLINTKCYF